MNSTMALTLVKYALGVIVILLLVFLIAVITPKLAALIDKGKKNSSNLSDLSNDKKLIDPKNYTVKDPYEKGEKLDGFDPNYKIYNEDIYGFKRKSQDAKIKSDDKGNKEN